MKGKLIQNGLFTLFLCLGMIQVACNKEEVDPNDGDSTEEPGAQNDPCNGGDGFCMTYQGVKKSGSATQRVINGNRVRVYWENGANADFEQVEIDLYGFAAGTYDVNDLATPNTAFVQYFSSANGSNNSVYGTVEVSAMDTNGVVTGTFNVTMEDSTKITDGKFTNIAQ